MRKVMIVSVLSLALLACSATVTSGAEPDAASEDVSVGADAVPVDAFPRPDAPVVVMPDVPRRPDAPPPRVIARLSRETPPAQTVPPNATGVDTIAIDLEATGEAVAPFTLLMVRRGVGTPASFAQVYRYGIPSGSVSGTPYRYSPARYLNVESGEFTIPVPGIRERSTTTVHVYADFRAPLPGKQHAFELLGIILGDGEVIPGDFLRGNEIRIGSERASQLSVRRGAPLGMIPRDTPGATLVRTRLEAGTHPIGVLSLVISLGGSVRGWEELSELELWRGDRLVPCVKGMDPFNGTLFFVPVSPVALAAATGADFTVRGRVTSATGNTLHAYVEYPADIRAIDLTLNAPAAVCIASTGTGGCDGPDQGSFDGDRDNASVGVVGP